MVMSEFQGNINNTQESLFVSATRGRAFVPTEGDEGRTTRHLTRRGKIIAGISIAALAALLIAAVVLLSIDWAQLPKYKEFNAMLGSSKAEVEEQLPDKVKYAGAEFQIVPLYEKDILNGFQYAATVRTDPAKAADVSLKAAEYLVKNFGDPIISPQKISKSELSKTFKGDDAYYMAYTWDLWASPKGAPSGYVVRPERFAEDVYYYLDLNISYHPSADDVHIEITFSLDEKRYESMH